YIPALDAALGIFIPLIVVNCIILERAESFASKNKVLPSIFDALGTGVGFTAALTIIGIIRELLGSGSVFGLSVLPQDTPTMLGFIMAPGGFITLGAVLGAAAAIGNRRKRT
ncbi:MAG: Rnf-Nqr domain containing protein, partial [Firmicutes bacterium]|nr:Rnf-Nqr domain containing protein [Bacillota bacterium]